MFPLPKKDGTEGMGTVEMTYKEEGKTRKLVMHGCFVRNDKNLQSFIEKAFKQTTDREKLTDHNNIFFYPCESELEEKSDKITKITSKYHRFTYPNQDNKKETLSYSSNLIFKVQEHTFLLCDLETIKGSKFLKKNCKTFKVCDKNFEDSTIYCMNCIEEDKPKLIPLKVINSQSSANVFGINQSSLEDYKNIEDMGPVLLDDGKTLVGSCKKTGNDYITLSLFGKSQDKENEDHSKESGSEEMESEIKSKEKSQQQEGLEDKLNQEHDDKNISEERVISVPSEETSLGDEKQEKLAQEECKFVVELRKYPGSEETDNKPNEKQTIKYSQVICQSLENSSDKGFVEPQALPAKNITLALQDQKDTVDSGEGDVPLQNKVPSENENKELRVSIEETRPGTESSNPLEEIKHSLPNGPNQLNDSLAQNIEKYRRRLLYLAENASEYWQKIGRNLDIKDSKLSNLRANNMSEGVEEQTYQMLIHWRESNTNPTLEKLLDALIISECVEIAKTFPEKLTEDSKRYHNAGIPVTQKLFNEIANYVKDKWKFLGRYLALDENTIQGIKMDYHDTLERTHQMLSKWKQKKGSIATSRVLINALEDVGKSKVAKKVEGMIEEKLTFRTLVLRWIQINCIVSVRRRTRSRFRVLRCPIGNENTETSNFSLESCKLQPVFLNQCFS